ncbi:hypothetical protein Lesp02_09070 [Lentzea sp. NBRC 105346]|uniref:prenyltransferase/squalene oxidase repeat-containing protein n=1 Tax=Lentzea sp. NBRC 105346 TaxID=3032205 RepID=UPI0024A27109|nr:prenyltransferase/squalene oxidase repeat-containing protein [Lentzea sp. NBRC 105346]GLZ28717.1 hypothetical protein Lesp02_09070 [Lentzea sp. NBRC 105346]
MEINELLSDMVADPWGDVTPSVYETARVVAKAPWLAGHAERIRYLERAQHADGTWGGPGEYALVPTLSAVAALPHNEKGRRALDRLLGLPLPDTVAVELIVPALCRELGIPADTTVLDHIASRPLPAKLWHTLEIFGGDRPEVVPVDGAVACSPAATATWLRQPRPSPSLDYLNAVQAKYGGPVPVGVPVPLFERAWVLTALKNAGIPAPALDLLITDEGACAGPGLPPDADDTATALFALDRTDTAVLDRYRTGRHFGCFPDERTPSTSTNAHVLQALKHDPLLEEWIRDTQSPEGFWVDKWHASPYYATVCCVTALHGDDRAADWVERTQRPDGSWGRWEGTYEETAYAIQILVRSNRFSPAIALGCRFLTEWGDREHPPLWHDKDLYTPTRIVHAEGMAALHESCCGVAG